MNRKFKAPVMQNFSLKNGGYWIETKTLNEIEIREYKAQKMASYLNHTATTDYLCCVPTLEESQELVV